VAFSPSVATVVILEVNGSNRTLRLRFEVRGIDRSYLITPTVDWHSSVAQRKRELYLLNFFRKLDVVSLYARIHIQTEREREREREREKYLHDLSVCQ